MWQSDWNQQNSLYKLGLQDQGSEDYRAIFIHALGHTLFYK